MVGDGIYFFLGLLPRKWKQFSVSDSTTVHSWMPNFLGRLEQIQKVTQDLSPLPSQSIWIGKLFMPEAYVTATRQVVSHSKKWSLESLELDLIMGDAFQSEGFQVKGKFKLYRKTFLLYPLPISFCTT